MLIIELMKKERIIAMKSKNDVKKNLLSCLISDACKVDKVPSDAKVIATVKSFLKNADELQDVLKNTSNDTTQVDAEIEILNSYLPKQLTEDEISAICVYVRANATQANVKLDMKHIMGHFKSNYEGQYDGATVSRIAKEML